MDFEQYYYYYLALHRNKINRWLHVIGNLATISFIFWAIYSSSWFALFFAPFVVYPFAWSGHFFFEKNKPAAWNSPIWAKRADWVMTYHILTRKLR